MRILMLSKALVVGAYQKKLEELARHPGVEITAVVPPYWREGRHCTVLERAYTQGYTLVVLPMALNGHYHLHFYPHLGALVRRARPDILHIDEEPYNLATFQAMRLGMRAGARCLFFTWQNIYRAQPFNILERYNLARACAAIAGNREAADVLRRKGFGKRIAVIPQFGVDPDVFRSLPQARAERNQVLRLPPGDHFVIGYLGRLVEQKGLMILLQAVAGLGAGWHLLLIGDGPLRPTLEKRARQLGIAGQVTIMPQVSSAQVPLWLNRLDVLVLPSLTRPNWKEQFGRVLVEAMACEIPVVGSESGEIPHVIGSAGLIAPEGDSDGLREHLARLMSSPSLRQALGRQGRQRVLARYTQRQVAQETYRFYETLIGQSAKARR